MLSLAFSGFKNERGEAAVSFKNEFQKPHDIIITDGEQVGTSSESLERHASLLHGNNHKDLVAIVNLTQKFYNQII